MAPEKKNSKKTSSRPAAASAKKGGKKSTPKKKAPAGSSGALPVLIIIVLLTVIVVLVNRFYDRNGAGAGKITLTGDDVREIHDIKGQSSSGSKEKTESAVKEIKPEKKPEDKKAAEPQIAAEEEVRIYLLKLNEKTEKLYLSSVKRKINSKQKVEEAIRKLIGGPTAYERKRGLVSAVPENLRVRQVSLKGKTAEIDFSSAIEQGAAGDILLKRIKQIVYTATQFEEVDSVVIKINGSRRRSLGSDGFSISGPLRR